MKYKAIFFDMFETLITEWGHEKYTKCLMCADLGIDKEVFNLYWDELEKDRYIGKADFVDSIKYVCGKTNIDIDSETLMNMITKRESTKSACFDYVDEDVYKLLAQLKSQGYKLGIISNCSSEEVEVIKESKIYKYFDNVILSYEIGLQKPDSKIYEEAINQLEVNACECVFVGDGGSNELQGAKSVGMKAIQAKWYTNQHPYKRENIDDFLVAERPLDLLSYIDK